MLTQEQKEEIIDAINSFSISDTIRINEYAGDLSEVNGYIPYEDALYVHSQRLRIDDEIDNTILEVYPCGGYDGSGLVNKSNYEVFIKEFGELDGVYESQGWMGTYAVFIKPELLLNKEIYETLAALCDYPCLDDTVHSEMENEAQQEAWEDWVRSDFETAITGNLNIWGDLKYEEESLKSLFDTGRARCDEYWYEDGGQMLIRVGAIAATITIEDLTQHDIGFELMDMEEE